MRISDWSSDVCSSDLLVSPVGAVNAGIELLTELGEDPDGESMGLIESSGRQAAQKLQFFRIVYGTAGAAAGIGLAEALRSEERRVGNECGSTFRSRRSP